MLLNGIDVRTAAGRLGHARASTTLDVYAHYPALADQTALTTLAGLLPPTPRFLRLGFFTGTPSVAAKISLPEVLIPDHQLTCRPSQDVR